MKSIINLFLFLSVIPITLHAGIGGGGGTLSSIADGNGSGTMSYNTESGNGGGTMISQNPNTPTSGGCGGGGILSSTISESELSGGSGGGGVFERQILVKYLSEKASEIKFSTAIKENGSWTTEVHALRPEEFTSDNQKVLEAISASKIKNGNWVESN